MYPNILQWIKGVIEDQPLGGKGILGTLGAELLWWSKIGLEALIQLLS